MPGADDGASRKEYVGFSANPGAVENIDAILDGFPLLTCVYSRQTRGWRQENNETWAESLCSYRSIGRESLLCL